MIQLVAPRIVVEKGRIQIHVMVSRIGKLIAQPVDLALQNSRPSSFPVKIEAGADDIMISAAVELTCRRGRAEIVDGKTGKVATPGRTEPKSSLIQTLVQAEYWEERAAEKPNSLATRGSEIQGYSTRLHPQIVERRLPCAGDQAGHLPRHPATRTSGSGSPQASVNGLDGPGDRDGIYRSGDERLPLSIVEKPLCIPESAKVNIGPDANRERSQAEFDQKGRKIARVLQSERAGNEQESPNVRENKRKESERNRSSLE